MRKSSNKITIFIYLSLFSLAVQAQKIKDTMRTEVIEVTRSFTPKVRNAYKLEVNPEAEKMVEKKIPVQFRIQSIPVASTFKPKKGSVANLSVQADSEDALSSYVSFGLGNYSRIKTNAFIFYPVTEELGTAFRLKHHSSQGGKFKDITYAPYIDSDADIIFDYNHENTQWKTDFGFKINLNKLRTDVDSYKPPLLSIGKNRVEKILHFDVNGKFDESFIKDINLKYNHFWDNTLNGEDQFNIASGFVFSVGVLNLKLGIKADYLNGNIDLKQFGVTRDETREYSYFDIGALPSIQIENNRLIMNIGAKIYYQDASVLYNNIQFIPNAYISYNLIYEKLSVYAGVTGGIEQNPYMKLIQTNRFLVPETTPFPSLTPYDVSGGLNGALSSSFSYDLKMGLKRVKNQFFYEPSREKQFNAYKLIYDHLNQSYFKTALNIGIGKQFDLKLKFDYMQNDPDHFDKAWNMPEYIFGTLLNFRPVEAVNIHMELTNISERIVGYKNTFYKKLPGYTDINVGANYSFNKHFSVFLEANNLLNKAYEQFYSYPAHALQILGGLSYRFDIVNNN